MAARTQFAAKLADSGVTVNVFRPGPVDTPVQAWIRLVPEDVIGPIRYLRRHAA